jgi:hypothetical protein
MKDYKEIPFYQNTPDDTHCFQASLKMIMKYFWPSEDYSWKELDKITAKVSGMWTWTMAGLMWLQEKGLEIKNIEAFDYEKFIQKGGQYLRDEFGEEVGNEQIKHCDIDQEIAIAKKFVKTINTEKRSPSMKEIKELLLKGYLIIVSLNAIALDEKMGYASHSVVIKGFDDQGFILNDPGLPGRENRKVDFGIFEKAWAYPNEKARNIMAFKLK